MINKISHSSTLVRQRDYTLVISGYHHRYYNTLGYIIIVASMISLYARVLEWVPAAVDRVIVIGQSGTGYNIMRVQEYGAGGHAWWRLLGLRSSHLILQPTCV